jgi:D-serine deaminase-like pyridoxal phosphate-dependent protein
VYDGHILESDFAERKAICDAAFAPVLDLQQKIIRRGYAIPEVVCGGSPTFPIHALYPDRILSPGTYTLWDFGYGDRFQELDFDYAAVLATRVISKPGDDRLCLDLGYKAVASEKPQPRIKLYDIENFVVVNHSEEHLVVQTDKAADFDEGDLLLAVPLHVCPTVALHDFCYIVENDRIDAIWNITARRRIIALHG